MIELKDVSFTYESGETQNNLNHINLTIQDGETILLCGESGCGKTTLTRLVNGLIPHYYGGKLTGQVLLDGKELKDYPLYQIGQRVGSVFQNPRTQFYNVDTTSEIVFGCENMALPVPEMRERLEETAHSLKLEKLLNRSLFALSGGERGRVSLAKLMLSEANFLILDEPTNHLDIASKEILEEALNSYTGTVFYVSHDRYFINQTATRILDLTNQAIVNYIGDYDYYLEKKEELTEKYAPAAAQAVAEAKQASDNKLSWQQQKEEQARKRKQENELKKVEKRIEELETRDKEIDDTLVLPDVCTNVGRCAELSREKDKIQAELEELYEKWEELA